MDTKVHAYISIGLNNGKKVQYVRDTVTDTIGKNAKYYGYEGPGYQDLGLKNIFPNYDTKFEKGVTYYFKVNIDGGGVTEYSITPKKIKIDPFSKRESISWYTIINDMHRAIKSDGASFFITYKGDVRCQSNSKEAGSSIVLSAGTTGNNLFDFIDGFTDFETPVAGDQLLDQTGAGKVYGDFQTLLTNIETERQQADASLREVFLTFPESGGDTKTLIRKNNDNSDAGNGNYVTQIPIQAISEVTIVEKNMFRY